MKKRINRRIPLIRRTQRAFDGHRLCEVVMDRSNCHDFICALHAAYQEALRTNNEVIIHYLSAKENMPSASIPSVNVQRITVLVDIMVESVESSSLRSQEVQQQFVDFMNILGDY